MKYYTDKYWLIVESFQLQKIFSFPFFRAEDLRTSLLIIISRIF